MLLLGKKFHPCSTWLRMPKSTDYDDWRLDTRQSNIDCNFILSIHPDRWNSMLYRASRWFNNDETKKHYCKEGKGYTQENACAKRTISSFDKESSQRCWKRGNTCWEKISATCEEKHGKGQLSCWRDVYLLMLFSWHFILHIFFDTYVGQVATNRCVCSIVWNTTTGNAKSEFWCRFLRCFNAEKM